MTFFVLENATAPITGGSVPLNVAQATFQATVAGTGTVSATVVVQVSNSLDLGWTDLATITLSGSSIATDGFAINAPWSMVRAKVTAIAGTNAKVTVVSTPFE